MIFKAENLYDLRDTYFALRHAFKSEFKMLFKEHQVGSFEVFEISLNQLSEGCFSLYYGPDFKKALIDKDFPLYFEVVESDLAQEKRENEGTYIPIEFRPKHRTNVAFIYYYLLKELDRAINKHPSWPQDIIHAAAIVGEESGELTRAALQYTYEGGSIEAARKEAIQTAVTTIRFLSNLDSYKRP